MSAGSGDQPQPPPAESQPAQASPAKESASPPPPSAGPHHVAQATTAHEPRRHADAPASSSSHSSAATTGVPSIGASATQAVPPQGIHVVQPSTYLGTYVRPRGLAERPMTPSSLLAAAEPPPLSLVDREQIEGLVSGSFPLSALGITQTDRSFNGWNFGSDSLTSPGVLPGNSYATSSESLLTGRTK
jgi:hypothetical protein